MSSLLYLIPFLEGPDYWRNVAVLDLFLSGVLFVTYTIYAAAVIRAVKALDKEVYPYVIFFFALPVVIAFIIAVGGTPFAFFVQNAVVSTPAVVYWKVTRDLDDEIRDYSLF